MPWPSRGRLHAAQSRRKGLVVVVVVRTLVPPLLRTHREGRDWDGEAADSMVKPYYYLLLHAFGGSASVKSHPQFYPCQPHT
jgi:hypothetical protein